MSNRIDGREKSIRNEFIDWLSPKDKALVKNLESQYAHKLKIFNQVINLESYRREWSIFPDWGTLKGEVQSPNVTVLPKKRRVVGGK